MSFNYTCNYNLLNKSCKIECNEWMKYNIKHITASEVLFKDILNGPLNKMDDKEALGIIKQTNKSNKCNALQTSVKRAQLEC